MKRTWLTIAAWLLAASPAAAVPPTINQEGLLLNRNGTPVEGPVRIRFSIYDRAEGGAPLWFEDHQLELVEGYYSVLLGGGRPLRDVLNGERRWLAIALNAGPEMTPRRPLNSVPYALVAGDVDGDIHPRSVSVGGRLVIDRDGNWVGPAIQVPGDGRGYDSPRQVLQALRTVDGSGSGVDADRLDGLDSSVFPRTPPQIRDLLRQADGSGSGVDADRLDGLDSTQFPREPAQIRELLKRADGRGSGVDADRLDGLDSSVFVRTADQIVALLRTADGRGSGIDADRLDGLDSAQFMRVDQDTRTVGSLGVGRTLRARDVRVAAGSTVGVGVDRPAAPLHVRGAIRSDALVLEPRDEPPADPVRGMVYLDAESGDVLIFDGEEWSPLGGGRAEALPRNCTEILRSGRSRGSGTYRVDPDGGDAGNAFDVFCDMDTDGGGWTLVWKHSYLESGSVQFVRANQERMRYYANNHLELCTALHNRPNPGGNRWCNVPDKRRLGPEEMRLMASHDGNVVYDYKGPFGGGGADPDAHWRGLYFGDRATRLTDRCGNAGTPPEPVDPANGYALGGITFDKHAYGNPRGNCDTDRYKDGRADCRWENCGRHQHSQMTLHIFVRGAPPPDPGDRIRESCRAYLLAGESVGNGIYRIDPDGGDPGNAFRVYCDMDTDGGGWTLVWKHSYLQSGSVDFVRRNQGRMRIHANAHHEPCLGLHDTANDGGNRWCNVPDKRRIGRAEMRLMASHDGVVTYDYKGTVGGGGFDLDGHWRGTYFGNTWARLADRCGNAGVPPEPVDPAMNYALGGITFDKHAYGNPHGNCDTDRYKSGRADCRWENCGRHQHSQMTLHLFVR